MAKDPLTAKFYKKQPLKTYIESQPDGIHRHILFARDRKDDGTKTYHYLPVGQVDALRELLSIDTHLYEILPPDVPVKPYFDLELERDGITREEGDALVQEFIQVVVDTVGNMYNVPLDPVNDFLVMCACRENKISFHVVIQRKLYFTTMLALKQFVLKFHSIVQAADTFAWTTASGERRVLMDIIPYGTDQVFKCINQSKKGKSYVMTNNAVDPVDSLIRLYDGVGDRVGISFQTESDPMKIPRRSKNDKAKETEVAQSYTPTGVTLMEKKLLSFSDLKLMPLWKQYLYLIPNTNQPRTVFLNVGFAIRNVGGTQTDYRNWAELSSKYDLGRQVDKFHTFRTGDRAFQLPFLKDLAKKAHPEFFDEGLAMMAEYFSPNFSQIRTIKEDCEYVSMDSDNILAPEQLLLLIARLGGGKTQAIKRLIQHHNYKRVLFVSPRITFSQFVAKEFNTTFYLDAGMNPHSDVITYSVESLWKLQQAHVKPYDLVVLDEIEANLSVFSSSTCKHQLDVFTYLMELVRRSQKTVFAGAFITQKTIDYITSFRLPTVCIWNEYKPNLKRAIELHDNVFILKLCESIQRGEKNYVCYSSLTQMKQDIAILGGIDDPIVKDIMESTIKLLTYSSESDDKIQKDTLQDIELHWGMARLVMTTPTITVGNSYKPSVPDFDNVWIRASPTCIVADTFQSHRRVRETTTDTLYYSYPVEKALANGKRLFNYKHELLRTFYERNENNAVLLQRLIAELITKRNNQMFMECIENRRVDLDNISLTFGANRHLSPDNLKELLMFNFKEQTLSNCYYKEMFDVFLKLNNYASHSSLTITPDEITAIDNMKQHAVRATIQYQDIPAVAECNIDVLIHLQTHKDATRIEKLQIEKYHFDKLICADVDPMVRDTLFAECVLKPTNMKYLYNLKAEINQSVESSLEYHLKSITTNETLNTTPAKLAYMLKLNDALGIPHSGTDGVVILREKIESIHPYIKAEHAHITSVFGFGTNKTTMWELAQTLALIKQMYKSWNRCEFTIQTYTYKKVMSITTKCHPSYTFGVPFIKEEHIPFKLMLPIENDTEPPVQSELQRSTKIVHQKSALFDILRDMKTKQAAGEGITQYKLKPSYVPISFSNRLNIEQEHQNIEDDYTKRLSKNTKSSTRKITDFFKINRE